MIDQTATEKQVPERRPLGSPVVWLKKFYRGLDAGEVEVPCNGCDTCCRSFEKIVLTDEEKGKYAHSTAENGSAVLDRGDDGACTYLSEGGCAVYDDRPLNCRQFDCRALAHCGLFPEDYPELSAVVQSWDVELKTEEEKVLATALRMAAREAAHGGLDALAAAAQAVFGGYAKHAQAAVKVVRDHDRNPLGLVDKHGKRL